MIIKIDDSCFIFFGDAQNCTVSHQSNDFTQFCNELRLKNRCDHVVIQKQVHGTNGTFIKNSAILQTPVINQEEEGDFLITNQPNIGVGILTADCLPIVLYVPKHHTIAVAHAGWRGSVANIVEKTITTMLAEKSFSPEDIMIYFGPSAKKCCYEIQEDFLPNIASFNYKNQLIEKRKNKLFFDVALLNKLQLIDLGINPRHINQQYNMCTICNNQYHSYRRCNNDMRQLTMAWSQITMAWKKNK